MQYRHEGERNRIALQEMQSLLDNNGALAVNEARLIDQASRTSGTRCGTP